MDREVTQKQLADGFAIRVGDGRVIEGLPYQVVSRRGGRLIVEEPEITEVTAKSIVLNGKRVIRLPYLSPEQRAVRALHRWEDEAGLQATHWDAHDLLARIIADEIRAAISEAR